MVSVCHRRETTGVGAQHGCSFALESTDVIWCVDFPLNCPIVLLLILPRGVIETFVANSGSRFGRRAFLHIFRKSGPQYSDMAQFLKTLLAKSNPNVNHRAAGSKNIETAKGVDALLSWRNEVVRNGVILFREIRSQ